MKKLLVRKGKTVLKIVSSLVVFSMMLETPGVMVNAENENVVEGTKPVANVGNKVETTKKATNVVAVSTQKTDNKKNSIENKFKDIGVAIYNNTNVRKSPKADAKVVAKMKKGTSGKILARSKEWYKIYSAGVVGFVKKKLLVEGDKVNELAKKYAHKVAKVKTETLNVREKADKNAKIVDQIDEDNVVKVLKDVNNEWVQVRTKSNKTGYVLKECVSISEQFDKATPVKKKASSNDTDDSKSDTTNIVNRVQNTTNSNYSSSNSNRSYSRRRYTTRRSYSSGSGYSYTGNNGSVVGYAKQFLGGKYVYGGQSLTNGTDCSGFTRQIYKKFGVNLPRTSSQQRSSGRSVSRSQLKAGDLVCYSGHVGIYAGNGKIVHASDPKGGIKVSNMNSCGKVVSYRRVK